MKERKIEVKVTFTEGYERRYTETCLKQIAKREEKKRGEDYGTTVQTAVYSERSIKDITY